MNGVYLLCAFLQAAASSCFFVAGSSSGSAHSLVASGVSLAASVVFLALAVSS